jgi:prophage regulatory protein
MSKRLLRLRQIIAPDGVLPIGRTRFYQGIADGEIPEPQKFGPMSLWDADAIERVLDRILAGEFGKDYAASSATMTERARKRRKPSHQREVANAVAS